MPTQEWIRDLLKTKGRKLKDVAETLDISAPRVTDILKGTREVQSDEILKLASLLDLSATALLENLSAGEMINTAADEASLRHLTVDGVIMGDGRILPLDENYPIQSVTAPADAETTDGLFCFIMGDDVLESEIKKGSIIIAANPRKHYAPIAPGALFLIEYYGEDQTKRLAPRQFHRTDSGEDWLIPLPLTPNPAFTSWRFELAPAPKQETTGQTPRSNSKQTTGKNLPSLSKGPVYSDHIFAAILWVQRRYMPTDAEA